MKQYIVLRDLEKTLLGRSIYTEEGALSLCWNLSGFMARFDAARAVIHFVPNYKDGEPAYVQVAVDGNKSKHAISTGKEKIVLEDLGEGAHTLKLIKLTEGEEPLCIAALEIFGEDCKVLEAPKLPDFRMEFIGDSITCGFGVLSDPSVMAHRYFEHDGTKTYAGLTAEALGADVRIIARSGQGIVKSCGGGTTWNIGRFFEYDSLRQCNQHDFTTWTPTAVVINAGTNDNAGGVTEEEFYEGVNRFLNRVREVYPNAHIFWAYGMMGLRFDAVLKRVFAERSQTDAKLTYVPIDPIREADKEIGACGHPSAIGHARAAKVLTAAIQKAMGL